MQKIRVASLLKQPEPEFGLSIIIVTYNSASVLPGLLDSLPAGLEGGSRFETIMVDNDSRDNSIDIALAHSVQPRVIKMGRNAGYAAAISAAAATVRHDADLLILNPDVRLLPGAVGLLVSRLTDSSVGVTVPQILAEDGTTCLSLRREPSLMTAWTDAILSAARIDTGEMIGDPAIFDRSGPIEWATGAILAVAARARCVVSDWDESFFLYSGRSRKPAKGARKRALCDVDFPPAPGIRVDEKQTGADHSTRARAWSSTKLTASCAGASGSYRKPISPKSSSVRPTDCQPNSLLPALPRAAVNRLFSNWASLSEKRYAPFFGRGTEPRRGQYAGSEPASLDSSRRPIAMH